MHPWPGERLLRFVGDSVRFSLRGAGDRPLPPGWRARLRTNLGRADLVRNEVIGSHAGKLPLASASWRDIPMHEEEGQWRLDLCLVEAGYFKAKAYAIDAQGRQFWPDGPDVGLSVHPDRYRTGNTIYCAFVRLFGATKTAVSTRNEALQPQLESLDRQGYTVIPASGKLRDLIPELAHIIDTLGCRIIHLLPVNPVPTTYARFGRFGSPYACEDLTAIDPALVEFDRRTTGIDQFRELTYAVHARGARVFLDVVTNHTGWGSTLQENHPDWFLRDHQGYFVSPGAWGVTWEDLVELDHRSSAPWDCLAEAFLTWCRRGVDGFRCDAGYKVPMPAWRYITARVHQEFPEAIFLLEGLGGSWEATENLLTEGGMQWAYSELFQNYTGSQIAHYLDYALNQNRRVGLYVHYSETHDNDRLASRGRAWSILRNSLCALTSSSGGYGFTCGVEWLAPEKINVHSSTGLAWNNPNNLVLDLKRLNQLLLDHPCFFDNAKLTRLSHPDSAVLALRRDSAEGLDRVLILINSDVEHSQRVTIDLAAYQEMGELDYALCGADLPQKRVTPDQRVEFTLGPGTFYCLSSRPSPQGLSGDAYRRTRGAASWALSALSHSLPGEQIGSLPWRQVAELVERDPRQFLASLSALAHPTHSSPLLDRLTRALETERFPQVVVWRWPDRRRITVVPPGHWLLIEDDHPFRATLNRKAEVCPQHRESIPLQNQHAVAFPPAEMPSDGRLFVERYAPSEQNVEANFRFLAASPVPQPGVRHLETDLVLLTNGIGGMARICVHLGHVRSKYDCLLAANLHGSVPVDRHVFAKRLRVWVIADGFISPLDGHNLLEFQPGPPAHWRFVANAGDRRTVEIQLDADMLHERNSTILRFTRPEAPPPFGTDLPADCDVRLTVRIDIEDRNFHTQTKRNAGADHHFSNHSRPLRDRIGFEFTPASDRQLRVYSDAGQYHHEAEWSENIPHPIEQTRGHEPSGDCYSPGWFDIPLPRGASAHVVLTADPALPADDTVKEFALARRAAEQRSIQAASLPDQDWFARRLISAIHAFVVRRGQGKTIIAGYPWFLDWGRDSLICARGLLQAGLNDEVKELLVTFGRFEQDGTLPNSILGEDASNRDTSDAPLWYGIACEELAAQTSNSVYMMAVDAHGRTIADVLRSIAAGYVKGAPNGIRVDPETGLVWSPRHFTWMDTNYPAGTPRAGYPVEIQVLWIRLLRQLARIDSRSKSDAWIALADRAERAFLKLFWLDQPGYLSDLLITDSPQSAAQAVPDNALRNNCLFAISLGLLKGQPARRCVDAALRYLVVPGALRTLAPLPVTPPAPIYGNHGGLLNDPVHPYWGRYEGDEDTRRKPAYHNGAAWTWTFPTFCEALARAWDFEPTALAAARAYLASMDYFLGEGCLGHIPEILDGDAPHQARGCDAQAWSVTEALRVWRLLSDHNSKR